MTQPQRISYFIMAVLLFLVAWLHLGTLALTTLFGFFALRLFTFQGHKRLAVAIYLVAVATIALGLFFFSNAAYIALTDIADRSSASSLRSACSSTPTGESRPEHPRPPPACTRPSSPR
jgi:hypothetical protein